MGGERHGVLQVAVADAAEELLPERVTARLAYSIVLGGGTTSAAALQRAVEHNVRAVIVGSIPEFELRAFLAFPDGLQGWRMGRSGWEFPPRRVGAPAGPPLTLILVEGFGRAPMATQAWELLAGYDGAEAYVDGTTRLRGGVVRPEIIVPQLQAAGPVPAGITVAPLNIRSRVRLLMAPYLGQTGRVVALPAGKQPLELGLHGPGCRGGAWRRPPPAGAAGQPGGHRIAMRVSITQVQAMKKRGERIVMVTAYDYSTARLASEAEIPLVLVGDSLGMVMLGFETTIPVTLDMMLHHTAAVVRGNATSLIIGDMPFLTYRGNPDEALRNAGRFLQEAGAGAVKIEGADTLPTVRRLVAAGIPVMGHLGLTPQSVNQLGGWKAQGKTTGAAAQMLADARALEEAGAFALVLETVPASLARLITAHLRIPTIGIGAGPHCDGQVQVVHDLLGWYPDRVPKHARPYAQIGTAIRDAFRAYKADVLAGTFPGPAETIDVDPSVLAGLDGAAPDGSAGAAPGAEGAEPDLRYGGTPR